MKLFLRSWAATICPSCSNSLYTLAPALVAEDYKEQQWQPIQSSFALWRIAPDTLRQNNNMIRNVL